MKRRIKLTPNRTDSEYIAFLIKELKEEIRENKSGMASAKRDGAWNELHDTERTNECLEYIIDRLRDRT